MASKRPEYDDDFFQDSRMTFGEHLEELKQRMWSALKGLGLCMMLGFALDGIGDAIGAPWLGVGKPALKFMTEPIETQVRDFYKRRNDAASKKQEEALAAAQSSALTEPVPMPVRIPVQAFLDNFDGIRLKDESVTHIECKLLVVPGVVNIISDEGQFRLQKQAYLTTLSITEAFFVYFKVSLLCGFIMACPWIFYQFWAFVGAGLYPHEKRYVRLYLPLSIGLFLIGVAVCQFLVIPGAVKALLGFNSWIGLDPDLRLSEWLGFAIIMPLVFGISFQTPLVMLFLNRLGMFSWEDYMRKWRFAVMFIAVFSAIITPTPDAVTMLYLFVPMFGLYMFGVAICRMMPPVNRSEEDEYEEEVAV